MPLNATPAIVSIFALTIGTLTPPARGQEVCTLGTINEINDILPICCGSTGSDDCASGMPPRCSPECAELLVPFWERCSVLMQFMGTSSLGFDVQAIQAFVSPCQQSLALVRGAESCEAGTGRGGDDNLQSWVQDVNDACCTQHGISVCRDGDEVPWTCNADCAMTFIPFMVRQRHLPPAVSP